MPMSQIREALTRRRDRCDMEQLIAQQEQEWEIADLRHRLDQVAEKLDEAEIVANKQNAVDRLYLAAKRARRAKRRGRPPVRNRTYAWLAD